MINEPNGSIVSRGKTAVRGVGLFIFFSLLMVMLLSVWQTAGAVSSSVVISEVLYDPTTTEPNGEWIELYNLSGGTVDLSTYKVGDEETSGGSEGMYQFPAGASIASGQVIVVANRAADFNTNHGFLPDYEIVDTNGAVPDMAKYTAWSGGSLALANSGDEVLLLDGNDALVDSLSWGSSNWAFNPDAPDVAAGHSLERNPANSDTDTAADWVNLTNPDPGNVVVSGPTNTPAPPTPTGTATPPGPTPTPTNTPDPSCGKSSSYTAVWEVQGNGHTSPLNGQTVNNVRGIVTADFQIGTGGPQEPRGFFIQAHEPDCDPSTSDGIFVYSGSTAKNISVGDLVEIDNSGVTEYQGPASFIWDLTVTELSCTTGCNVTTLQAGYGLPPAEEYDPPADAALALAYNEAREGMLMQVTVDTTVIAPSNEFNEFIVRRGLNQDRLHREDGQNGLAIMVDGDGVAAAQCGVNGFGYIKTFDSIAYSANNAIYGPLNYNFNMYKVQQDDDTVCVNGTAGDDSSYNPAANPPPTGDSDTLTIAIMNAWNFFDTNDDPQKSDPVATQAEYDLNSLKRAAAVCDTTGLNRPYIIGLQEIENDTVLQKLAGDINSLCGVTYNTHTLAGPDNRSIEVGFLTRADVVTVLAFNDRQGCSSTNWGIDYEGNDHPPDVNCTGGTPYYLFNRPPLELEAQVTVGGQVRTFYVINNHFKSKLSSASCSAPDCTDRRVEQAQHVDNLVDGLLATDPNANIIVMGDLNDYYNSDPLDVLDQTNGVLTSVWDDLMGPPSTGQGSISRYSYIYNGIGQTLDHMLVSDALNVLARNVSPRHINADWPASHLTDNSMHGSSDHDFLLVGFDFTGSNPTPTNTPLPTNTPTPTNTPAPSPTATNTPLPTATNTPLPTATNTPVPTATNTPGSSTTLHVADLDGSSINNGGTWTAVVTILVVDNNGTPVSGATVSGDWSNGATGSAVCVTNGSGTCDVTEGGIRKKEGTVTFTVSGISHATLTYNSAANTDPDGDSDGTTIIVSKP